MRRRRSSAAGGFTLVEAAISVALIGSLIAVVIGLLGRAQELEAHAIAMADLRTKARFTLDRITRELRDSGASSFDPAQPAAPLGASGLTFRRAVGFSSGAIQWGPPRRIEWRLAPGEVEDGLDNNGNGLADEGQIRFIENPGASPTVDVVLCDGVGKLALGETADALDNNGNGLVDERGLAFELLADVLIVRITLERSLRDGSKLRIAVETAILIQNP